MHILGISGSPRKGGNTGVLLDAILEGARSVGGGTKKIVLNDLDFKPCQECGGCDDTGICTIEDDMQLVYQKLQTADAVVIASPIFFGSLSAQVKMMIDRLQCLWVLKYVLKRSLSPNKKRHGVFLCVGGKDSIKFFENAKNIIKIFFNTLDITYLGDLFYSGLDKKSAVKEREDALKKAFILGIDLVKSFK